MIASKKILLIEDDSEMSNLLSSSLSDRYPCTVDVAQDSFEAMNMMTERFYDLVILDWNLPGFNGGETLVKTEQSMVFEPRLPAQWDHQKVPVVVLSSSEKSDCVLKKTKHFTHVGFVSKAQPLKSIVNALAASIEGRFVGSYWAC